MIMPFLLCHAYACPSPLLQVAKSAASGRTSVSSLGSDKRGKATDTKKKVVVKKIVKKKVPYLDMFIDKEQWDRVRRHV
jgi:hypothetical protein